MLSVSGLAPPKVRPGNFLFIVSLFDFAFDIVHG